MGEVKGANFSVEPSDILRAKGVSGKSFSLRKIFASFRCLRRFMVPHLPLVVGMSVDCVFPANVIDRMDSWPSTDDEPPLAVVLLAFANKYGLSL